MQRYADKAWGALALAMLTTGSPSLSEEAFPLVGTYTENEPCKPDSSNPNVSRVTITTGEIDSAIGICKILDVRREGEKFAVHVDCKDPTGSQLLGDVTFTVHDDKTIDFSDQDQTYKAVLYKCP